MNDHPAPAVTGTAGRLRRLLAMLAWLAQVGEAPIDEVADRFGLAPDALVGELELAACCGLPPYTPDQLMEIVVTDTSVSARLGALVARPRRLTPRQGFALATAARALLAIPGSDADGALSRALSKLEGALGAQRIAVELDTPPLLELVAEAVDAGTRLEILYYSASSDRLRLREIEPRRLFAAEGHWYVDADCLLAGGVRRFRVDRIGDARPVEAEPDGDRRSEPTSGSDRDPGPPDSGSGAFVPGPDTRTVRIVVEPEAVWMVDSIPTVTVTERSDGRCEIEVVVGGDAWLDRLLLRLGRDASVVAPDEDRERASAAAGRVLRRYERRENL